MLEVIEWAERVLELAEGQLKPKEEDLQIPEAITYVVSSRGRKKWTPSLSHFRS